MRIGFDIDGVFADFEGFLYTFLKNECKVDLPSKEELFSNYYWDKHLNLDEDTQRAVDKYIWTNPNIWLQLPFLPSSMEVQRFNDLGLTNEFYFITARPSESFRHTLEWLHRNLGNTANFQLITGAKSKAKICQGLNLRYFLDDSIVNVYETQIHGTTSYLFDNLSNHKYTVKTLDKLGIKLTPSLDRFFKDINKGELHVA